jgi:hypothetical protein
MQFGIENSPSTWRGVLWIFTGLLALAFRHDLTTVATIIGTGATVIGSIGVVTRAPPRLPTAKEPRP